MPHSIDALAEWVLPCVHFDDTHTSHCLADSPHARIAKQSLARAYLPEKPGDKCLQRHRHKHSGESDTRRQQSDLQRREVQGYRSLDRAEIDEMHVRAERVKLVRVRGEHIDDLPTSCLMKRAEMQPQELAHDQRARGRATSEPQHHGQVKVRMIRDCTARVE
jgi:hypothetical protein